MDFTWSDEQEETYASEATIQIHGSLGVSREYGIEHMLRDAIPATILSGTSERQRDIIASEVGL